MFGLIIVEVIFHFSPENVYNFCLITVYVEFFIDSNYKYIGTTYTIPVFCKEKFSNLF